MDEEKKVTRRVSDLGAGAYLLMHGFKVSGKTDKDFIFSVFENEVDEFEDKQMEYLQSEFHRFDACLMSLKKWKAARN
ncbi:MAG: hypothetical protein DWQ19_12500 [Crenarchaeota archaeon]|nr:MAG: hypothetical protein DWQ19_12500 [Thermoproteota archaeon]